MKTWKRARVPMSCGRDVGCIIPEHEAYLEIAGEGWKKARCKAHAGEPEPTVISEEPVYRTSPRASSGMSSTRDLARFAHMGPKMLKFDPRKAAANDREE